MCGYYVTRTYRLARMYVGGMLKCDAAGNEQTGEVIKGIPSKPSHGDNGSILFEGTMIANRGTVFDTAKRMYFEIYQPLLSAVPKTDTTCQQHCSKECNFPTFPKVVERFGGWDTELHGYYRSPLKDAMHRAMAEAASGGTRGCAQVCWRKCREETQHNQQCIGANSVSMADILQVAGAMGVAMSEGPNYVHDIGKQRSSSECIRRILRTSLTFHLLRNSLCCVPSTQFGRCDALKSDSRDLPDSFEPNVKKLLRDYPMFGNDLGVVALGVGAHTIGKMRDGNSPLNEKFMDYTPFVFDNNHLQNVANLDCSYE
eukprot:4669872-Pyramimonas_sp.AAC.3